MIDVILHNARIHTMDFATPTASAVAIIGERIVAVGANDDILPLASANTTIYNLNGRFVMPGMIDAHIHWENTSRARHAVDLWQVPSKAEALKRIAAKHAQLPAGEWLTGHGWAQDIWEDNDRQFPTRDDLDAITGDRPAYFRGKSGHVGWANSAALRIGGIDRDTPDPIGGKIVHDDDGEPNGILFEAPAMIPVDEKIPVPSAEKLADWMAEAQAEAWRCGLVGIHDYDNPSAMVALQRLRERGELGLRVVKQINFEWIDHAHELGIRSGFGDTWLRIGGLKLFADGALGPRTAYMIEPYEGEPDNYGVVVVDKDTMYTAASKASKLGLASTIHAIGDRAVHDVLDIFETIRQEEQQNQIPRSARRHRIEHVQIIHPDDVGRLAELDIIASMQPIHAASDWEMADRYWGDRAAYSYQWRLQLDAGATLVFGSDAPIDPFDPRMGLYAAITRQDLNGHPADGWYPDGRLTLDDALHAYTVAPAYAAGLETQQGKLAQGYLADLIVADDAPHDLNPQALLDWSIVGTMVGGIWRHREFD